MASQPWPGQEITPQPVQRALPRVINGPPRQPTPRYDDEATRSRNAAAASASDPARAAAEARKAAADAAAAEDARRRGGLTAEQFNSLQSQYNSLGLLESGINEVDRLYNQYYRGRRSTIGGMLPNAINPINRDFEAASDSLMSAIASAQGLTAQQQNTPAELRIRFGPLLPRATDDDATIESKLTRLRSLLQNQRSTLSQQLGIHADPAQVQQAITGMVSQVAGAAGAQNPIPPGAPYSDPNAPPPAPPDPNRVQPGESMGQVGNLPPLTDSERTALASGRNELDDQGGAVLTAEDRQRADRLAGQATALARRGLSPDAIDAWLRGQGVQGLSPEARQSIENFRNRGRSRDFPGFAPTYIPTGRSAPVNEGIPVTPLSSDTGFRAGLINFADSASLGLPGLFSEEYRNRLADVREQNPVASTVGALAGGIIAPGGPRPGMNLATQSLRSAGQGAAYGLNSSGGSVENALVGGAIGGAAPGVFNIAGRGVRGVGNYLVPRGNYDDAAAQALAQAGQQEGVPLSRPILDPASRDRMAYLESSVGSGNRIREGLQATRQGIESRAGQLGGAGTVEPNGVIGQRIQDAGQRYIARSGDVRTRLYDRATQMAGDAPVYGREAVNSIDEMLAELAPNAPINQGQINYLQNLRSTFVDDAGNLIPRSVQGIRDLRTEMRTHIDNGTLTRGPAERRVLNVLSAARQDIERDLGRDNPAAVRAYQRADRFNAERASEIRQVVQRVIGRSDDKLSGEQVMTRLRTMAGNRGDADRLDRLWQKLTPEERADAAATIASTAGRRSAEEGFEPGQFIAWARTLSPAARQTIFGPEGAQSIANLRSLSKALMDTTSRLNNTRSGVVANWRGWLRDLTGGGPAGAVLSMAAGGSALTSGIAGATVGGATALTGLGLRKLSARTLMNPDVSRWLAASARVATPSAIRAHIERLQPIARLTRNQAVSQEILGLRQALLNAVNDNVSAPMRAAADSNTSGSDDR